MQAVILAQYDTLDRLRLADGDGPTPQDGEFWSKSMAST